MPIGSILKDIGRDLGTGAKRVGTASLPILKSITNEESGEDPQIHEEERQQKQELQDAAINTRANYLESQLAMGEKYGTLTPDQQKQTFDELVGLYSHPSQMGTLMERFHRALHPNGTTYQPQAEIPNATPKGGIFGAAEREEETVAEQREKAALEGQTYLAELKAQLKKQDEQQHLVPKLVSVPGSSVPIEANYSATTGLFYNDKGEEIPNAKLYSHPAAQSAFEIWKQENPDGTLAGFLRMKAAISAAANPGTWQQGESASGKPVLFNSRTGQTRAAPSGLRPRGWYEKNIAPLDAAAQFASNYGTVVPFSGPGDVSLIEDFYDATRPASGFRMTTTEIDLAKKARSWVESGKAKLLHAKTGRYLTDEQVQQMRKIIAESVKAKKAAFGGSTGASPVGGIPKSNSDPMGLF